MDAKETNSSTNESKTTVFALNKEETPQKPIPVDDSAISTAGRWTAEEHLKFIEGIATATSSNRNAKAWKAVESYSS